MTRNTPFTSTNHCVVVKRQSLRFLPEHWIENGHVLSLECGKYFMDLRVSENGSEIVWSMAGVRQVLDGSTEGESAHDFPTKAFFLIRPLITRRFRARQNPISEHNRLLSSCFFTSSSSR